MQGKKDEEAGRAGGLMKRRIRKQKEKEKKQKQTEVEKQS